MTFKKGTQSFTTSDPTYTIPVVRTRNTDSPATVKWRTKKAQRFDLSGPLKFNPGETEKNIVIDPKAHPGPIQPETFQLELFDPSSNASVGERKTTTVNVTDGEIKKRQKKHTHIFFKTKMKNTCSPMLFSFSSCRNGCGADQGLHQFKNVFTWWLPSATSTP